MYRKVLSLKELDEIMNDPSFTGAEDVDIIILPTDPHSLTDEDEWGIFEKELIDEMIIKYFGHHGLKQFIRGKPIRFGYKFWALCGSSGFCFNFDLYAGRTIASNDHQCV